MVDELVQGYLRLRRLLTRELGSDDAAELAQESFEVALRLCQVGGQSAIEWSDEQN